MCTEDHIFYEYPIIKMVYFLPNTNQLESPLTGLSLYVHLNYYLSTFTTQRKFKYLEIFCLTTNVIQRLLLVMSVLSENESPSRLATGKLTYIYKSCQITQSYLTSFILNLIIEVVCAYLIFKSISSAKSVIKFCFK